MALHHMLRAAAGNAGQSDPYFEYNTLLLTGDGTNGAQNNTFLDSSTNNFTITRNGNTTQGLFSPYGNLWSNYFDGNGDYLTTPTNTALALGSGNWTVETWVYANAAGYSSLITWRNTSVSSLEPDLYVWNTGVIVWYANGTALITGTTNVVNAGWVHVAVCKSGTSTKLFVNGVQEGSTYTDNNTYLAPNTTLKIGGFPAAAQYLNGYLSNTRIVKGTALYTTNFTPSTTPLTAVSGTSLLTCQSNRFIDNSSNNFTLTVNGNTSVQRFSPFNPTAPYSAATIGGSGYFDGTGDLLSIASSSQFSIGSSTDFTFETWVYYTGTTNNYSFICYFRDGTNSLGFRTGDDGFSNRIQVEFGPSAIESVYENASYTVNYLIGRWTHLGFSRISGVATFYINGVNVSSKSSNTISLGASTFQVSNTTYPIPTPGGYVAGTRLVVGTGINFSSVGVPTAPPTPITNTKLLCNFTNAGIPDAAMMNDLETVGNAQVSTSVKKYGTGSLYFDGSGDALVCPSIPPLATNTGDMTLEMWIYPASTTAYQTFFDSWLNQTSGTGFYLWMENWSGGYASIDLLKDASTYYYNSSSPNIALNTWSHLALTRASNTVRLFINGTQAWSTTVTDSWTSQKAWVGWGTGNSNTAFKGYIDDLRITKGYARYTSNFTPPTAALPTY